MIGVVHSGTEPRIKDGTLEMLDQLSHEFGRQIWKHVVLIITKRPRYTDLATAVKERRDYEAWLKEAQHTIRERFGLSAFEARLPAVKMDNWDRIDYTEKVTSLINTHAMGFANSPFRCDQLESPLDQQRNQEVVLRDQLNEQLGQLERSVISVNALIDEIESIERTALEKMDQRRDYDFNTAAEKVRQKGRDVAILHRIEKEALLAEVKARQASVYESALDEARSNQVIEDELHTPDAKADGSQPWKSMNSPGAQKFDFSGFTAGASTRIQGRNTEVNWQSILIDNPLPILLFLFGLFFLGYRTGSRQTTAQVAQVPVNQAPQPQRAAVNHDGAQPRFQPRSEGAVPSDDDNDEKTDSKDGDWPTLTDTDHSNIVESKHGREGYPSPPFKPANPHSLNVSFDDFVSKTEQDQLLKVLALSEKEQ